MDTAEQVKALLLTPQKIIITTHQRPDGDAIGSSLGLFHFLKKKPCLSGGMDHEVYFISPTDYPEFLKWMPGNEYALIFEKEKEKSKQLVEAASMIFCLDFNQLYRLEELGKIIGNSSAPKILIDHHLHPDSFPTYQFWNPEACSTAELVYQFILEMDDQTLLDETIATCLYAGILTDTDRFRIRTTSPAIHRIVADLMEYGINHTHIHQQIYETFTQNRMKLFGYCIGEKLWFPDGLRTGIIAIEPEEMKRFNIQPGDTEGLVNYPLMIQDIVVSALITPGKAESKLSLRSRGNFSVERICREHFEGGGHFNASGGRSELSVIETVEKLVSILARFKNELQQQ